MCQEARRELRGQAGRPRLLPQLPSEFVCQLPREESGDRQAGELRNCGWEIQQEKLGTLCQYTQGVQPVCSLGR